MPVLPDKLYFVTPDYWNTLPETNTWNTGVGSDEFPFAKASHKVNWKGGVLGFGLEDAQDAWKGKVGPNWNEVCLNKQQKTSRNPLIYLGRRWFWRPLIFKTSLNSCWFTVTSWNCYGAPDYSGYFGWAFDSRPFLGDLEDTKYLEWYHKLLSQ